MGLSSKQVSSDGLDWSQNLLQELPKAPPPMRRQQQQNQQQQSDPLKCPRCDSANTKFCYYNNYNKSQPRHFCRACKRHWTKGGTLRNVPVGGGRKNKRIKKSTAAAPSATTSTSTSNTLLAIQGQQQQRQSLPVSLGDQRCMSEILYQSLLHPPSSLPQKNLINSANNNNNCLGSTLPHLPLDQTLQFPFSSSSSFNTNPLFSVSASFPSSNVYNYSEEINTKEAQEPTITTSSSTATQPWQIPTTTTTTGMDMSTYWNWEDMDPFASTDLNLPWDDSEIKP